VGGIRLFVQPLLPLLLLGPCPLPSTIYDSW